MAKELPYFKFEPSSWDNGNIQICSKESKGLFIDICSMYWTRLGELPYALALQKHCNGNKDALQELINNDILLIKDDQIIIEFLDEQLNEFFETSEKRRIAANKRWNAKAMQKQYKSNAIREDKKREDKKREDNIYLQKFEIFRQKYQGTKRGLYTEFENLQKKHKNWKEIIELLTPNLERQIEERKKINGFVPEWKHLQTYINQNGWELEYKQGQQQSLKKEYKP